VLSSSVGPPAHGSALATSRRLRESRLANLGAQVVQRAFHAYASGFHALTRRAKARFESRDWWGMRSDATQRLDQHRQAVDLTVGTIRSLLGERIDDRLIWAGMKAVYSGLIADRDDWEIAETFFNSITRRIFDTVGVDAVIEFVDTDFDVPPTPPGHPLCRAYAGPISPVQLMHAILEDAWWAVPFADAASDTELAAALLTRQLTAAGIAVVIDQAELLTPVSTATRAPTWWVGCSAARTACLWPSPC
jgi:isocitrate dehydrogenase kinase/phosphatase